MFKYDANTQIDYEFSKKIYFAILIFTFTWIILIFLAPVFLELGGIFGKISSFIYLFFSTVCHQNDSRSFHILEHKLGVCSRCVSIYAGFFAGTSLYPLKYKLNNINPPSIFFLVFGLLILLADVILDNLGIMENTFLSRSVTGFVIGILLPLYIIPGFVKFFYELHSYLRNKISL